MDSDVHVVIQSDAQHVGRVIGVWVSRTECLCECVVFGSTTWSLWTGMQRGSLMRACSRARTLSAGGLTWAGFASATEVRVRPSHPSVCLITTAAVAATRARSARTLREPRQASIRLGLATSSTLDRYAKSSSSTGPILVRPRRGPVKQVITGEVECAVRINDLGRSMAANLLGSTVGVAEGLADGSDVRPERRVGFEKRGYGCMCLFPFSRWTALGTGRRRSVPT
jgi:hypothetical protein